ncbi:hypothetical protein Nepgr_032135 [Nepenthes gracilis]|uniref:Uncharacterized protein n=1 Tax=Nepenthes gracilis TaxID=150966 RepID=A0AAD3TIW1_NEPGR|nr:hypothetical protein Nepgr_032135 [Nepenthes gracilis]
MAPVHNQSSHPSPIDNPHSPKSFLSSDLVPVSTRPVSDFSYMGVIPESPSPPSLHSEFARSTLLAELPVSVDVDCAPQKSKGYSIPCSVDLVPDGLGNCMASPSKFPVGSLPVNPGPSIVGGLDAGVSPLGSSSPPRLNMRCSSSVMSPVYSASSIIPASCDALLFCPELPKNSPVTTHPCGADADNKGDPISLSRIRSGRTMMGLRPIMYLTLPPGRMWFTVGTYALSAPSQLRPSGSCFANLEPPSDG